jgi:hypothetical protein
MIIYTVQWYNGYYYVVADIVANTVAKAIKIAKELYGSGNTGARSNGTDLNKCGLYGDPIIIGQKF